MDHQFYSTYNGLESPGYGWSAPGGAPGGGAATASAPKAFQRGMGRGGIRKTGGNGAGAGSGGGGRAAAQEDGDGTDWNDAVGQAGLMLDELAVSDLAEEAARNSSAGGPESWPPTSGALAGKATMSEGALAANAFLHKSIIDRIQEDFPRTPSPVFSLTGVAAGGPKPAHAKALPSPKTGSSTPMSRNSASHLSSPTHALPPQSESEQGGGEHMASQPPSGGSGAGMSPLQSPSALMPVLEGTGLPLPGSGAGGVAPSGAGGGYVGTGAAGMQGMAAPPKGYTMDASHQQMLEHHHHQQQQHQHQQLAAAAALQVLQHQALAGVGISATQVPPGCAGANGGHQMPLPPYAQNQQLTGGYGAAGPSGSIPFTNPQMAAALMALNQSSSAATIGSAGAGAGGLPTTGMQGIGGEVSADSIDWAAVQGLNNVGLPDGAQQHHQQQQAAQQLAALQSLQNLNPIALQNLLSQVTIAQAQHNFRGGLAGAPLGGPPQGMPAGLGQGQQGAMAGNYPPPQQGLVSGMAPLPPQVLAQMKGAYDPMAQSQLGPPLSPGGFQQLLQRGGNGGGNNNGGNSNYSMGPGGDEAMLGMGSPAFGRGRGGGGLGGGKGGERGRGGQGGNAAAVGRCSALLEEFRGSRGSSRKLELRDILGHCEEFCRDQHGSRFIQTKLDSATAAEKQKVFEAVLPVALGLMKDLFGNYVCQKFLERGSPEQRDALGNVMRSHVLDLSLDMFGCRVVQKAIEVMDGATLEALVSQLQGSVMTCVRDQNGNHVIQKCIECSPSATVQFIIDDFEGQVVQLGMHPYGCRVIQRILEHCPHAQVAGMLQDIVTRCRELVLDQYGNYVVQHVLEHGDYNDRQAILRQLNGHIVGMSQHKFASNVVEKLLQLSDAETRTMILNEITGMHMGSPAVLVMMKDPYGNYVIQKALDVCQARERERLVNAIREHLHAVRKLTYGKHIMAHIEKLEAQATAQGKMGRGGGGGKTGGFLGPVGGGMRGGVGAVGGGMGGMGIGFGSFGVSEVGTMAGLPRYHNAMPSMSPTAFQQALMGNTGDSHLQ